MFRTLFATLALGALVFAASAQAGDGPEKKGSTTVQAPSGGTMPAATPATPAPSDNTGKTAGNKEHK